MGKVKIMVLINSKRKINIINSIYAPKLSFKLQKTDINILKIDDSSLEIYGIVIAAF